MSAPSSDVKAAPMHPELEAPSRGSAEHLRSPGKRSDTSRKLLLKADALRDSALEARARKDEWRDLRRSADLERQRTLALLDFAPDSYLTTDSEGLILEANQAAASLLHMRRELLAGSPLPAFVAEGERSAMYARLIRLQLDGLEATQRFVTCLEPRQVPAFPVEVTVSLLGAESGAPFLGWMLREVTERKGRELHTRRLTDDTVLDVERERRRQEAILLHSQKLESLGSLAGGVAHDMNNVLQAIAAMAAVLQGRFRADPSALSYLETIVHAADRGRGLVKNLTDFARKGLNENRPIALNDIVRKEAALLRGTTLQKLQVAIELEEPSPWVLGEPSSLANALMNLCLNALDAMPRGGRLLLRTRTLPGGQAELSVQDAGSGMAPDVAARAAEPFFTTKPEGKGTGLGLSIVHNTMKTHRGSVEIQSEVGKGTTVLLRLPITNERPVLAETIPPSDAQAARSLRLFLVDDDPLVQAAFSSLAESLGHQVAGIASDGAEALRRLEGGLAADVVVLDHNMPGMSGCETLRRLRVLDPSLRVLFSSGFMDDDSAAEFLAVQQRVWTLPKPYSRDELGHALNQITHDLPRASVNPGPMSLARSE